MRERILDRRGQQRRHLVFYLDVFDAETGAILGQLGDITTGGMLLISDSPLAIKEEGELRSLKVMLPKAGGFTGGELIVRVKTCWTSPDFNPDLYCTGFQYVDPDDELFLIVNRLIGLLGFRE